VKTVATVPIPDQLPPAITRPRQHVEAVLAQSIAETGEAGRAALAWHWALTGTSPSPVTLSLAPGHPPARQDILAEAAADPEISAAPPGVPTDFIDQLGECRRILRWLVGDSDEIPADCDNRGQLIGARGDYARTDQEIRQVRDLAQRELNDSDLPYATDPVNACNYWPRDPGRMNAAWLQGIRDLLDWVLGDRDVSPLSGRTLTKPPLQELDLENEAAEEIVRQGRLGGTPADPSASPPHYGEGVHAAIHWLRGQTTAMPARPYDTSDGDVTRTP
jgi:hypothetical protein